uniref:Gamma-tubulin complex component 6 n=1 Tax=Scleropages formosus TaxID=113540 RepID=A0A8C9WPU1_SCLFO
MNGGGGSITELLGALCDTCISGVSWRKRAVGATSPDTVRRALRRRAYGTLLAKLFQQESPKAPCARSAAATAAATPPRNKVLMISLDLRLSGCQEEAEKLEELLWKLGDGPASGLGELDSVLELLVQLAGSVPPPPASFNRDYMRRERPVLRRPPLTGYHSKELQQLEARAWSLVCREEWGALGAQQRTLGLMDGLPGTGLPTLGRWSDGEDRFERETRLSLFGALQNTRTTDLDIRLDLPPVPSNIEVTGLAIRVPPAFDQSEDEGFQSASNLTPDSQSEPSPSPEVDVWEALRNFEPSWRRCWENVGWPPGKKEDPYLTEAGREAFDHLYRLREGEMRVVCSDNSALPPTPQHSQKQLVADFLNVLIGVTSDTFLLNQFEVRPGVCVSGASPESISRLLAELAQYGTHYLRLSRFSLQSAHQRGLVFQAFTGGLRRYLQYYRACVLSTPPSLSLLTIGFLPCGGGSLILLSYLYNEALSNCSNENYPVLLSLLKSSCEPYTRFVSDWVYSGVFRDVYKEFMIQVNEDYLSYRDKHFWVQGYTLISQDVEECVPVFLRHIANDVYVCGKTINLLKICCPQHYICWSELPVPRIAVTFSMQEVEEIERDCAVYRGRMERIAKHSALSREEQILHTEQARQELISHVRESTAKTLETIRGRQVSQRLAQEAKKRERFEEIKHHLEQEREWRSAAKRKEQEDDFSFARELRDREKRLRALEEQLERRTKLLIAQYSRMSEEATRRERRAVWRVQRLQLNEARTQFLEEDQRLIQVTMGVGCVVSGQSRDPQIQGSEHLSPKAESENVPGLQTQSSEEVRLDNSIDFQPSGTLQESKLQESLPEQGAVNTGDGEEPALKASLLGVQLEAPLDVSITVGDPAEVEQSLPGSSYGHASDSTLEVGCIVSGTEPVQKSLPGSSYGHASDSTLEVGCIVSGTEPVQKSLPGSSYGHASDSTLEPGCVFSGTEPVQKSLPGSSYGHASDSTLEPGCVFSGTEPVQKPLPGSSYGHASDSTLGVGCVVSGTEPVQRPLPGSSYGHASDSTLGVGCVVSGTEPVQKPLPGSSYGHASDSTLGVGCVVSVSLIQAPLHGNAYRNSSDSCKNVSLSLPPSLPLAAAPDSQLLQQVTRGPYGFPGSGGMRDATDTTAVQLSEMVSLPVLIKHSVTTPLSTHVSLVNKAVVDYFFVELGVEKHFEALRHFLLMEDGEFAQSLSDLLFEKLASGQTPGELLTPLVLNSILSKALQYSLHGGGALAANFTFALRFLPERFHPHAPDVLQCLELRYKVDWPLNIVITDNCMNKYNRLFSFLLQLKHMVWTLRDVWFHLKRAALVKGASHSTQFRQLQLYRHEMQHFVKVIQGYIANQILQVSWSEFIHKLGNVSDLDSIHHTHADYLNRAIFRGLLTEKAAPVMNIIHSIFSLILKFRAQLIAQPWSSQQGETVHPSFVAMQQSYNTFKYYSHFLFKVVTKLVNRGYQPHLEDFLLRINFNNYYKDS